jgi:hypothetical protein
LIRHAPRGSTRAPVNGTPPAIPALSPCRCAALVRPDGGWNIFLVNRAGHEVIAEISLPERPKASFDLYRFDRQSMQSDAGRIDLLPSGTLEPDQKLKVVLPPESFVVAVEKTGK